MPRVGKKGQQSTSLFVPTRKGSVRPFKTTSSGKDTIVRDILHQMSEGYWTPAKALEVKQKYGIPQTTIIESAAEASRHLRLMISEDPEAIRGQAAAALQAISVEAREKGEYKSAVEAINVFTRLWGLQTVVHENKTTKVPSHLQGRSLLEYLESQISEWSDMRDELRAKLLREGSILADGESATGWVSPPGAVALHPDVASPVREGSRAFAASPPLQDSAEEAPLGLANEPR